MKRKMAMLMFCWPLVMVAQNPFLPMWEHIPDGEPYVFDDPDQPGRQRIYIYGSHDTRRTDYCGLEQVVWSAPVEHPTEWRYDGVILESVLDRDGNPLNADGLGDVLFAPDVTVTTDANGKKTYWLYPNNQAWGRNSQVACSDRPDGPFTVTNWSKDNPKSCDGILQFDPAVFTDDDGRIYGYWGFAQSWGAELDPETMCTLKTGGRKIENLVPGCIHDETYRFYEASSMRKIEDKYVLIYSRLTREGEFGMPATNYTLAYAYSDHPLGPFTYGGTIIDARARDTDPQGNIIPTANPTGNTHGSLCKVGDQWFVFYHRQTGVNEYSRQAMADPVEVKVEPGRGGRVYISEAKVTSEGLAVEGLNPQQRYPAAIACWLTGPEPVWRDSLGSHYSGPYVKATYPIEDRLLKKGVVKDPYDLSINVNPVINCTDGSILGYKYFNMSLLNQRRATKMVLNLKTLGVKGRIDVMIDSPWTEKGGQKVGSLTIPASKSSRAKDVAVALKGINQLEGKHALYLVFSSPVKGQSICEIMQLQLQK